MSIIFRIKDTLKWWRLRPNTRAVRQDRLTYLSYEKLRRLEQALSAIESKRIAGDLVEFGVALGGSAIIISAHAGSHRHFHGFDVFAMIPPPTSERDDEKSRQRYQIISSGDSEGIGGDQYYGYRENLYDDVRNSFSRHGRHVDGRYINLHKGLFEETWPRVESNIQRLAFVHIDCDWYDPVKFCLDSVADRMATNGMILIDDYNDYGGCRSAVDGFLEKRRDFTFEHGENPILTKIDPI